MVILGKTQLFVVCFSHPQFYRLAYTVPYLSYINCNIFSYECPSMWLKLFLFLVFLQYRYYKNKYLILLSLCSFSVHRNAKFNFNMNFAQERAEKLSVQVVNFKSNSSNFIL